MWFEATLILIGGLFIIIILRRNMGTKTPDLFRKYFYEYIPRLRNDHDSEVVEYYTKHGRPSSSVSGGSEGGSKYRKFEGKDSKGEMECRRVLEKLFKKPFTKSRPDFLNNDVTYQNLELDCYNSELKLGCEYQGEAHYKYIPHFHKNMDAFRNQQYRDYMKKQKCKENGVVLIEVPHTVDIENMERYIARELEKRGIAIVD